MLFLPPSQQCQSTEGHLTQSTRRGKAWRQWTKQHIWYSYRSSVHKTCWRTLCVSPSNSTIAEASSGIKSHSSNCCTLYAGLRRLSSSVSAFCSHSAWHQHVTHYRLTLLPIPFLWHRTDQAKCCTRLLWFITPVGSTNLKKHTYIKLQLEIPTNKQILTYTCNHTKL